MCIRAYEARPARPYISSTSTYSLIIKQNWLILIPCEKNDQKLETLEPHPCGGVDDPYKHDPVLLCHIWSL